MLSTSTDVYDFIGWFGVVVLMAIESTAIPLPSEVVMPLAGWKLVAERGGGVPMVFVAGLWGAIGSLLGSLLEYWLARVGGRPLIYRYGRWFLITHQDLARADKWFATRGELTVFIARMIPGVRGFISIPAGVARMNVFRFSLFTFLGAFPWTLGLAWGGFLLGEHYDRIREVTKPFDIPIIGGVLLLIAWFLWHRIRELRREQKVIRAAQAEESSD